MEKKGNIGLFFIFLILCTSILLVGNKYKTYKTDEYTYKKYSSIAESLSNEVDTLIKEKQNATLLIAISFSKSHELINSLSSNTYNFDALKNYSKELKESTDFKNVWIQLVDKNGISKSRSWIDKSGDDLSLIREDVVSMNNKPQIKSSVSVGKFDMSFKAMAPIYDDSLNYIGFVEVITHFNSIAQKIKNAKFEPVVLVNKKYKQQITEPFSQIFAGDNYVANKNADKNIVKQIIKNGLDYYISPYKNYIIDKKNNCLVVNYTLFDTSKHPMANFLMFKKLKDIDMSLVESMKYTINLIMSILIILTIVFFYFISNKESIKRDSDYTLDPRIFISLFVVVSAIYYVVLEFNFEQKKEKFFKVYNKSIQKDYQIIQNKYSALADSMYNTVVNKPDVLKLVNKAYGSKKQKDKAREELYNLLVKDYEFFKSYDLRQFHFHLKNNESFLRFHRPSVYGDSLIGIRATVEWVNKHLTKIVGFEEGRIYNGFRYVYPMILNNYTQKGKHIGSVELTFSAYSISTEFAKVHNTKASFIVREDVVGKKVFKSDQSNYLHSPFNGYLYEKSVKEQFEHTFIQINTELLTRETLEYASKKIVDGKIFSILSKDKNTIFTFLPFKNPVSKNVVAAMILQQDNNELSEQNNLHTLFLLFGMIIILFATLYIYKEFSSKYKFQQLSLKTQRILDAQNSIIILTDGEYMLDSNKKLLEYFGYLSLDDFRKKHNCICDFFEVDDRFFHIGKTPKDEFWIDALEKLPYKEHIVAMKDLHGKQNIFFVSISNFDNNHIITFNNISDTMIEHFSLMERVIHDKLTGAYNRDYFESRKDLWIQEVSYKHLKLGIMIVDIDHFKNVNDTYGHNRGDEVLKHLVSLIHKTIRQEDILIRWGGEEFLLIINVSSLDNLFNIAENIRKRIENEIFEEVGTLTCSFGLTIYNNESIESTIERADKALYEAKNSGRNRVISKE